MADTISGSTTSNVTLAPNSSGSGAIDSYADSDWWKVSLTADQTYVFDLRGWHSGYGSLADPWLGLASSTGTLLSFDDDSGYVLDGRLVFTPSTSGTYFLIAEESGYNATGTYTMSAATDIGDSLASASPVALASPFTSSIQYAGDVDAFRFTASASSLVSVQLDLPGSPTNYPTSIVVGNSAASVTSWIPAGDFVFTFGAPSGGDYYILVGEGLTYSELPYTITVTSTPVDLATAPASQIAPLTGDNVIDAMVHGYEWALGQTRTITWAIADNLSAYWSTPDIALQQIEHITSTFEQFGDLDLRGLGYYTSVESARVSGADIVISFDGANAFFSSSSQWGRAFFPAAQHESSPYPGAAGDVWINLFSEANDLSYEPGSSGFFFLLHELGHALGLKHPHDDGGTGHPTFLDLGIADLDVDFATVMSYNDDFDWNQRAWEPATPMVLDVLALQALYGANESTNAGNSTHAVLYNAQYQSIWDPSGMDTVSAASSALSWTILLPTPLPDYGYHTSIPTPVGYAVPTDDLALASPTTLYWLIGDIENAIGSTQGDLLFGNASANTLSGNLGDDYLAGSAGNDTLLGGDGDDVVRGDAGNDSLHGGVGFDWAYYDTAGAAVKVTLVTGAVQNTLGAGFDSLAAIEGVLGTALADNLAGNSAANALRGELGNDTLLGASGNDSLQGGEGDDIVRGDNGDDSLDGGAGTDWAYYNGLASAVSVNLALAGAQNTAGGGSDTLAGIENVLGTSYADTLVGDGNANYLRGEVGNDTLNGGAGNDTLLGANGDDVLRGEAGNDSLHGGAGFDWAYYDTASAAIKVTLVTGAVQNTLGAGSDSLAAIEGVFGTAYADNLAGNSAANALRGELGNDTLFGASGNDTLLGGDGDDIVRGDGGDDSLDGGAGTDSAYYNGATGAVTVSLAIVSAQNTVGSGLDTLANIENVLGTSYADRITGNTQANYLRGEVGNDTLNGGAGNDTFLGGTGADRFEYSSALNASTNVDRILDYSLVDDLIALDNDIFSAFVTENVALAAAAFRSGAGVTTAGDADDRIAYNTTTGALYYDSDGAGGAASTLFATLANKAALEAADFFIAA